MIVKLLTEQHLGFLSLKGGCKGSSESTIVKMSNCWKSYAAAQLFVTAPKIVSTRLQSMVHHRIYPLFIFDLTLVLHKINTHVTYASAKLEVAMSNSLGGDIFTRKYILLPWHKGHMKFCPVPTTS